MMTSKGVTLLAQIATFDEDILEWRRQSAKLKIWLSFKMFFYRAHREQKRAVTTTGKEGYTVVVYNIYGVPPPPPEEHHEAIDSLNTIIQWIQTQSLKMEGRV